MFRLGCIPYQLLPLKLLPFVWNIDLLTCPSVMLYSIHHPESEFNAVHSKKLPSRTSEASLRRSLSPQVLSPLKKAFGEMKELEPQNGSIRLINLLRI